MLKAQDLNLFNLVSEIEEEFKREVEKCKQQYFEKIKAFKNDKENDKNYLNEI